MARPFKLSDRLEGVSESATLKLNARAQALRAQGVDVVNFTAGEPDFMVPDPVKEAAAKAIRDNRSKYTPVGGIPELRVAIAEKTNRQQPELSRARPWKVTDVVVTNGGKQAIFNTMLALLNPGDEVVIPAPYWLSYPEMVKVAGAKSVIVRASAQQKFKISPEQLSKALSGAKRARLLILNSPSNPTGAMYSREEFQELGKVLERFPDVWVLSDEIYDEIVYDGKEFVSFLASCPELCDRSITVNGLSKSVAMTGWRVGWSVAPDALTQGMLTLQGQSTSGINSLMQWASIAALKLPDSVFREREKIFQSRRDLVLTILGKARKMECVSPEGAFYVFPGIGKALKPGEDSFGFCERLLDVANVAVVPGTPFGAPEYIRLSFATDERSIQEGCERLVKFLES